MRVKLPQDHTLASFLNGLEATIISAAALPGFIRIVIPELAGMANLLGEGGNEMFIAPEHLDGYNKPVLH